MPKKLFKAGVDRETSEAAVKSEWVDIKARVFDSRMNAAFEISYVKVITGILERMETVG